MKIEIYERLENRIECRTYEIADGCIRILVDKSRFMRTHGNEVWGVSSDDSQVEAKLTNTDPNVVLIG